MYLRISLLALVGTAMALPADTGVTIRSDSINPNDFCTDGLLYTAFQCCVTRVLGGVASLDCSPPHNIPEDCVTPEAICEATIGGKPQCCTIPLLGIGLLCQDVYS
ncbi:fungal hydrophobin-domain-containing protein [Aspergillus pseudoustus]|uniref:Fungal hydrophobin-domain-containing protein n=1 Tax=Aspergillus pseudoustus TaxID=1810923 RepID=A0ABR4IQX0_9EURO